MKVKIREEINYAMSRDGHRSYYMVDESGNYIPMTGIWKTKKACLKMLRNKGFEYADIETVHKNYQHWMVKEA